MSRSIAEAVDAASLAGQNRTLVVVGGTLGVGAAVARKFASLGCERIYIVGRNETRASKVLEVLHALAPGKLDAKFIKGDLSTVKGMKQVVEDIGQATGPAGIDYLIMTQNGTVAQVINETEDHLDSGFAVQALSRFAMAYLLTTHTNLKPGATVLSVANTGLSLDNLQVDDLSLIQRAKAGRSRVGLFWDSSRRDSTVLDAFIQELQTHFPHYRYCTMHPGVVKSEEFKLSTIPFPFSYIAWLAMKTISQTPDQFAVNPVYIALNLSSPVHLGEARCFNNKVVPGQPGAWASKGENRTAIWRKLKELIGEA